MYSIDTVRLSFEGSVFSQEGIQLGITNDLKSLPLFSNGLVRLVGLVGEFNTETYIFYVEIKMKVDVSLLNIAITTLLFYQKSMNNYF